MKFLLLGASGLLGAAFARAAARRAHHVVGWTGGYEGPLEGLAERRSLDLADLAAVERGVLDLFPDAIVNCAAVARPDRCDADPEGSRRINVDLPEKLALLARHLFAPFLHVSTDLVFDGRSPPYAPDDITSPMSEYGRQKAASENRSLAIARESGIVLRLPLLNGNSPRGDRSLHESLMAQWGEERAVRLHKTEIRQPCLADNAAAVMVELLERDDCRGRFHWAGAEALSRLEIARRVLRHFGLPPDLAAADPKPNPDRPADLSLVAAPLAGRLRTPLQPFDEQLDALKVPRALQRWYNAI